MHEIIKNFIEFSFGAALFLNAALFLPQLVKLIKTKNGQGLSLLTFGGFCFIQLLTILHGIITSDYILVFGYILSLVMCGAVTVLIIFYKIKRH